MYSFLDKLPMAGKNYYRLKIIDLDASASYSHILLLDTKSAQTLITTISPNPTSSGNLKITLEGSINSNIKVSLHDATGRMFISRDHAGQNTTRFETTMELKGVAKGSYLLRIDVNEQRTYHRVIIQ